MTGRTITVTLPDALYRRAKETAEASSLTLEDALTQFIAPSLPGLEDDLPSAHRSDLTALPLFSDAELWRVANSMMVEAQQDQLEKLAELQKQRSLTETEQADLANLVGQAQLLMLRKAEAYRLLARRGYHVFTAPFG